MGETKTKKRYTILMKMVDEKTIDVLASKS